MMKDRKNKKWTRNFIKLDTKAATITSFSYIKIKRK